MSPRSPRLYEQLSHSRQYRFKKGASVYDTDDFNSFMLVKSGFVKRYMIKNDGSLGIQIIYGPQDVFSFTRLFENLLGQSIYEGPETYHYQAMTELIVYSINSTEIVSAVKAEPMIYKELFAEAGHHLKYCVHNIENIGLTSAYTRVAHQLLFFARSFGAPVPGGVSIQVPLTHQSMADILSTTRETVTLAITTLREVGVLLDGRQLVITNMDKLSEIAYT